MGKGVPKVCLRGGGQVLRILVGQFDAKDDIMVGRYEGFVGRFQNHGSFRALTAGLVVFDVQFLQLNTGQGNSIEATQGGCQARIEECLGQPFFVIVGKGMLEPIQIGHGGCFRDHAAGSLGVSFGCIQVPKGIVHIVRFFHNLNITLCRVTNNVCL